MGIVVPLINAEVNRMPRCSTGAKTLDRRGRQRAANRFGTLERQDNSRPAWSHAQGVALRAHCEQVISATLECRFFQFVQK
ncbi:MAG: hypothetical protein ACJ8C9_02910 [Microvirga sp.]